MIWKHGNKHQFKNIAKLTFWGLLLIKIFAEKLCHLGKHMKIDSEKPDKKRNNIMRKLGFSTITKKVFHLTKRQQNSKRKFLTNNALRHPYQRLTEWTWLLCYFYHIRLSMFFILPFKYRKSLVQKLNRHNSVNKNFNVKLLWKHTAIFYESSLCKYIMLFKLQKRKIQYQAYTLVLCCVQFKGNPNRFW